MYRDSAKEVLSQAMIRLLNKKNISHIHLSDILSEANVSRSTFYRNFIDKYALMNYCFDRMAGDVLSKLRPDNCREIMREILTVLSSNRQFIMNGLYSLNGEESLREHIYEYTFRFFEEQIIKSSNRSAMVAEEKFAAAFISSGFLKVIEDWIRKPESAGLSISEIADLQSSFIHQIMESVSSN